MVYKLKGNIKLSVCISPSIRLPVVPGTDPFKHLCQLQPSFDYNHLAVAFVESREAGPILKGRAIATLLVFVPSMRPSSDLILSS